MNKVIGYFLLVESIILILAGVHLRLLFVVFIGLGFGLLWLTNKKLMNKKKERNRNEKK